MITKDSNKAKGKTIVLDKISDFDMQMIDYYKKGGNVDGSGSSAPAN